MTVQALIGERRSPRSPTCCGSHQIGDIGWIAHRQGMLYAQEYGWDETYEALVAEIAAAFVKSFDPKWERSWIAEREGEVVGSRLPRAKSDEVAKLRLLYVEPSARGLGIGNRLVEECIGFARAKGYRTLTLWTNDVLVAARKIYEAAGFRLVKEERTIPSARISSARTGISTFEAAETLALAAAAATGIQVGAALVATRFVVNDIGPASLAFLRYAVAVLCLVSPLLMSARTRFAPRDLVVVMALGIVQFGILIALLNLGLHFISSTRAALLFATFPLMTMVIAALLGRENLTGTKAAGVV